MGKKTELKNENIMDKDEESAMDQEDEIISYEDISDLEDLDIGDILVEEDETEDAREETDYEKARRKRASTDMMAKYLDDVGKYDLLTPEEEKELFVQLHCGDKTKEKEARDKLVLSNLRLVISIAKKYKQTSLKFEDLTQEGVIGLVRAIDNFDVNKGFRLSTYATWWIRQSITRSIADKERTIRIPVHLNDKIYAITRAQRELLEQLGREATLEETAAYILRMDSKIKKPTKRQIRKKVEEMEKDLSYKRPITSLDAPVGVDGDSTVIDFIGDEAEGPEKSAEKEALAAEITELLNVLPPREEFVIRARYGMPNVNGLYNNFVIDHHMTLEEIGDVVGVTRERIRQIESRAMRKMKSPKYKKKLVPFKQ